MLLETKKSYDLKSWVFFTFLREEPGVEDSLNHRGLLRSGVLLTMSFHLSQICKWPALVLINHSGSSCALVILLIGPLCIQDQMAMGEDE
jgi:hypothetical protein